MKNVNEKLVSITGVDTVTLDITSNTENYVLTGTKALLTSFVLNTNSTPDREMTVLIWNRAAITIDSGGALATFTILGTVVNHALLLTPFVALCSYINGGWVVQLFSIPVIGGTIISINATTGVADIIAKSIDHDQLKDAAGILASQLADATSASMVAVTDASKKFASSTLPSSKLAYLANVTTDLDTRIGAIETAQTTDEGDIDTLQTDMGTAQSDITSLKGSRTADEADIAAAQSDISALQVSVGAITTVSGVSPAFTGDFDCDAGYFAFNVMNITSANIKGTLPRLVDVPTGTVIKFTKKFSGGAFAATVGVHAGTADDINGVSPGALGTITIGGATGSSIAVVKKDATYWELVEVIEL